jgi:cobalt-zinc-cadmium efflux system outer membrane protein
MFRFRALKSVNVFPVTLSALMAFTGCTVHPPGEGDERHAARIAGKPFEVRFEQRVIPPLPADPVQEDLVRIALLSNADLEKKYWEWRSAIEQIPQDGTQATNLVLSANLGFTRGSTGLDRTTLSAGNDPMADIILPPKLSAAARWALENARAAGLRYRKAQFEVRNKVLTAYYDYALTAELIRLEQANGQLLKTTSMVVEARNRAGAAGQQDLLKASNELDLSGNDIAAMQAQLPAQRAALNSLLGRESDAPIPVPVELPPTQPMASTDAELLARAAKQNPELSALAMEIAGKKEGIALAKLQYLPDFSVSAATDLKGIGQSLLGMITVPYLRHEAIDAAVAQSQANLRAAEAMRRQMGNDLNAQVIMDITALRDADRQLQLFDRTILPRTRQIVTVARSAYESGHATLLDLLDSQRSLISIQRLVANLRITREKKLADLEAITADELQRSTK